MCMKIYREVGYYIGINHLKLLRIIHLNLILNKVKFY